jgi:hypothetical protein
MAYYTQSARDKPHVNVGGLLEQASWDKSWESCRNGLRRILAKEKHVCKAVGACSGDGVQKVEYWDIFPTL